MQTNSSTKIPYIAFIDDGINPYYVQARVAFDNYIVNENGVHLASPVTNVSHGTVCYKVFSNHVNVPYRLISLQVLCSETGIGNCKSLLTALDWCANQEIDLINISMGTQQYTDFTSIAEKIKNLSNTIIVAACNNQNTLTFPACLPNVIGVRHYTHNTLKNAFTYFINPYDQIEIFTYASDMTLTSQDGMSNISSSASNSFAAPVISARICQYITEGIKGLKNMRSCLIADAISEPFIMTRNRYKELFYKWESPNVPIIAVADDGNLEIVKKMAELVRVMIADGYCAIGLSISYATDISKLLFQLKWQGGDISSLLDLIVLYYNFTLPDIILLHMPLSEFYVLPSSMHPDALICFPNSVSTVDDWESDKILNASNNAELLFNQIKEIFV